VAFIDRSLGEADGLFPLGSQLSTADIYLNMLVGSGVAMLKHPAIARTFTANHY
jgi:hypothetical protein